MNEMIDIQAPAGVTVTIENVQFFELEPIESDLDD